MKEQNPDHELKHLSGTLLLAPTGAQWLVSFLPSSSSCKGLSSYVGQEEVISCLTRLNLNEEIVRAVKSIDSSCDLQPLEVPVSQVPHELLLRLGLVSKAT